MRESPQVGRIVCVLEESLAFSEGDVWQYAVEIEELRRVGSTNSALRFMLANGMIEHAHETTSEAQARRRFVAHGSALINATSCFVLCSRHEPANKARTGSGEVVLDRSAEVCPRWDGDARELSVEGVLVKRFKVPATNQIAILEAFHEEDWPHKIDDPLHIAADIDPKRRLHDTINSLNRSQKRELLRFSGDGTGQAVKWSLVR